MFGSPSYESRAYNSAAVSRVLSPKNGPYRGSPRLLNRLSSPHTIPRESDTINVQEFINEIQRQLKRVSSSFSFQFSSQSPLMQAVAFLTQAIDCFLQEKTKSSRGSLEYLDDSSEKTRKLTEEFEKNRETSKTLNRYEQLLKKKEEKLEEEKRNLKAERSNMKDVESHLRETIKNLEVQEKNWTDNKKSEQERINQDRDESERKLNEAQDIKERLEKKIEETTKHFKHEKETLVQLENCLNQTKQSLVVDQKRITQDKLEIEKDKWDLDQRQRKVEETEALLQVKIKHIEQQKLALEADKAKLQVSRKSLDEERVQLKDQLVFAERDSRLSQRKSPDDINLSEKNGGLSSRSGYHDLEARVYELDEREKEIEQAYRELQEQMDNFNRELEEREIILEEREISVEKQERDLKKKFDHFQIIENSLIESKIQVEDLRSYTIPELEKQSEILGNLLQELNDRKNEAEGMTEKLFNEVNWILSEKERLDVIPETSSHNSSMVITLNANNPIEEITADLEHQLEKVREKEEELELGHIHLESEREELVRTAEFLKKAHVEVEEKKKEHEREINQERENLKSKFLRLETAIKALEAKEAEVSAFKTKLEEKSAMLQLKEAEISKIQQKTSSRSSSIVEE